MRIRTSLALAFTAISLVACEKFQATADRAMMSLQLKPQCPDAVPGRAVGSETPEGAAGCFRNAASSKSTEMMLRVTCHSRAPGSCKQTDAIKAEAERTMSELGKMSWKSVLGRWEEGKATVFAIDTRPGEKIVTTIVTCKIAEGDRWAVCEIGEISRDEATSRAK